MITKDISYESGGTKLTGYYAVDDKRAGKRPGILVCHQGGGLREHEKERARMLAELGYAALPMMCMAKSRRAASRRWLCSTA